MIINTDEFYDSIGNAAASFKRVEIPSYMPTPTDDEIAKGYMDRYFVQRTTDQNEEIIEVNKATFDMLQEHHMYRRVLVTWRIAGKLDDVMAPPNVNTPVRKYTGVLTANRLSLELAAKEMPAIVYKIRNLKQHYIGY
jgi:hypothetical protein